MPDIAQIKLPDNTTYDLKDAKKSGIYTVKGTQTASTSAWTGVLDVPALYAGLTIMYYLPYASKSTSVTLNLTLSGGSTTGSINCYYSTARLTTHYGKGCNIIMTYWPAGTISVDGVVTTDNRWIANANYTDGNTNTWRAVNVNGTQLLGTGTGTGAVNFVSGTNVTVSGSGNDITISASGGGGETKSVTIPSSGWTYNSTDGYYYNNITVSGVTASDNYEVVGFTPSSTVTDNPTLKMILGAITYGITSANTIKFIAFSEDIPTLNITVILRKV